MTSILDISASSDSEDDVDYVPDGEAGDESFDEEDACGDNFKIEKETKITNREDKETEININLSAKIDEKQRAEDLWKSFLNDVESVTPKTINNPPVSNITNEMHIDKESNNSKTNAKPVCKIFEFAGETLTVSETDFNCDSHSRITSAPEKNESEPVSVEIPSCYASKKRGLDSVLGTIMNKNKKLSVLDKSLIDWQMFKKDEDLDSELKKFNKGKQGFIERQRFLERSDIRSFEIEKSTRQRLRKK